MNTDPARLRWAKKRHKERAKRRRTDPYSSFYFPPSAPACPALTKFAPVRRELDRADEALRELADLPRGSILRTLAETVIRHCLSEATYYARRAYGGNSLALVLAMITKRQDGAAAGVDEVRWRPLILLPPEDRPQ